MPAARPHRALRRRAGGVALQRRSRRRFTAATLPRDRASCVGPVSGLPAAGCRANAGDGRRRKSDRSSRRRTRRTRRTSRTSRTSRISQARDRLAESAHACASDASGDARSLAHRHVRPSAAPRESRRSRGVGRANERPASLSKRSCDVARSSDERGIRRPGRCGSPRRSGRGACASPRRRRAAARVRCKRGVACRRSCRRLRARLAARRTAAGSRPAWSCPWSALVPVAFYVGPRTQARSAKCANPATSSGRQACAARTRPRSAHGRTFACVHRCGATRRTCLFARRAAGIGAARPPRRITPRIDARGRATHATRALRRQTRQTRQMRQMRRMQRMQRMRRVRLSGELGN
ncbi:Uncharacterised protein [Burkholderia pseudomallei]|nr:Uncharacterised protein [Burkholderia pseudomallei]CAJ9563530.1 Uncharacterised protein [Burkholderia pseudomallei]CAJ9572216.1 Uncharacterised protein [Burkholderia pseudomallei]CAK1271434.1 Uncharacterised protein [Burkholderia pseudomallei]CFL43651.1 Uncharacterised protein [Burkholderia pseudomallei]